MARITKVCETCKSTDVVVDAWAAWNEGTQEYELDQIFDNSFCNNCEGECKIIDQELPDVQSDS